MENLSIKPLEEDVFYTTFGNGSRLELKNKGLPIDKIVVGLQKFDTNTNKQIEYLTFYIGVPAALNLAEQILNGNLNKIYEAKAKVEGKDNIITVFTNPGGVRAETANRPDKKPLYRELSISKGKKWMLKIATGPGKITKTGGIAPDGKTEKQVSIGLTGGTLNEIAIMIKNEYLAYRTSKYLLTAIKGQKDKPVQSNTQVAAQNPAEDFDSLFD